MIERAPTREEVIEYILSNLTYNELESIIPELTIGKSNDGFSSTSKWDISDDASYQIEVIEKYIPTLSQFINSPELLMDTYYLHKLKNTVSAIKSHYTLNLKNEK